MPQPQDSLPIELISWNRMYDMARRLSEKIRQADFRPDIIVAIARGGYIPARILCDFLGVRLLCDVRIVHYEAGARRREASLAAPLSVEVKDRKVLIVDDVTDTGDTLRIALEHISAKQPAAVKTAVLIHKANSPVIPDFHGRKIVKWRWTLFPWAVIEDLSALLNGAPVPVPDPEAAQKFFAAEHNLRLPAKLARDLFTFK